MKSSNKQSAHQAVRHKRKATDEAVPIEHSSLLQFAEFDLEMALSELFGMKHWSGTTSLFEYPKHVQSAVAEAISKIEMEVTNRVSTDERLRGVLLHCTDSLKKYSRQLEVSNASQIGVIARLLHIIAYLLGFDHGRGEINRHVIYYQTQEQLERDVDLTKGEGWKNRAFEYVKRYEVIKSLQGQGIPRKQIALIVNIPYHRVCAYLRKEKEYLQTMRTMEFMEKERAKSRE
ncbi:MAG: hypothetical protein NT025_07255 [bacterium]|nr:hypothetical protein [bacterium]